MYNFTAVWLPFCRMRKNKIVKDISVFKIPDLVNCALIQTCFTRISRHFILHLTFIDLLQNVFITKIKAGVNSHTRRLLRSTKISCLLRFLPDRQVALSVTWFVAHYPVILSTIEKCLWTPCFRNKLHCTAESCEWGPHLLPRQLCKGVPDDVQLKLGCPQSNGRPFRLL